MRILFMGTPDFAAVSLRALTEAGYEICGVFTQPDKPRNRNKVTFSPVKEYALTKNLQVFQPVRIRDAEAVSQVRELVPDLVVVTAYGQILPKEILEIPRYGCINVHASLLPKYQGAAPINWAILNDEPVTGVSIMCMAERLDAGDVLRTASTEIGREEDLPSLWARLAELGGRTLTETIPLLAAGNLERTPQRESEISYAPKLTRALSPIDWNRSARSVSCQVRGLLPWPCASAELAGRQFKIYRTAPGRETDQSPGAILSAGKQGIEVACGDGRSIWIEELQAEGGKRMSAAAYLLGHPILI